MHVEFVHLASESLKHESFSICTHIRCQQGTSRIQHLASSLKCNKSQFPLESVTVSLPLCVPTSIYSEIIAFRIQSTTLATGRYLSESLSASESASAHHGSASCIRIRQGASQVGFASESSPVSLLSESLRCYNRMRIIFNCRSAKSRVGICIWNRQASLSPVSAHQNRGVHLVGVSSIA